MAAAADAGFIAGAFYGWLARRTSSSYTPGAGYPMGSLATPDSPSVDTVYSAYKLVGVVETGIPAPTRELASARGGLVIMGQRAMGVSDFGSFDLTLAYHDETVQQMCGGSAVDVTTHGNLAITAPNTGNANLNQLILGICVGIQTDSGDNQFLTMVFGNVQITYPQISAGQDSGVNPRPVTCTVVPSLSDRVGWGMLYSATGLSVQNDADMVTYVRYTYPMHLVTYIDNGSTGGFTLPYLPTSNEASNATNVVLESGAKSNPTSINTGTGAVAMTAADSGDPWTLLYGTNFISS